MTVAILLSIFLTSVAGSDLDQGRAGRSSHAPRRLHLQLVRSSQITNVEIEAAVDQIRRIWRQESVEVELLGPDAERPATALRLELTEAAVGRAHASGLCALGAIRFINGVPEPQFTVSVGAVRQFVRQARPVQSPGVRTLEAARIVGRVAAHEIGHYLLGDPRHQPTGLMRSRFDGAELFAPRLEPFAPPPRHELTAGFVRLGHDRLW